MSIIESLLQDANATRNNCGSASNNYRYLRERILVLRESEAGRDITVNTDLLFDAVNIMHAVQYNSPSDDLLKQKLDAAT